MKKLFWISAVFITETALAQMQSRVELHRLKKLTIGPSDNYQGISDGENLYFTRSSHLAPQILSQNLASNEVKNLFGERTDGKDPSLSPDGKRLAFVSYRDDAKGDICVWDLQQNKILQCSESNQSIDEAPFWIDDHAIGFVARLHGNRNQILRWDLKSDQKKVWAEGNIWAPDFEQGWLVYIDNGSDNASGGATLVLNRDGDVQKANLDLPGVSGFPRIQAGYLYFTHFLNDSNGDNRIDGRDNGVIMRMPLQDIWDQKKLPEQLTSVEFNCSYPSPHPEELILTCAFGNSLDLYSLPLTGQIPEHWQEKELLDSHKAARTYEHRLLVYNTLRSRFPDRYNQEPTLKKIIANHLWLAEADASQFYLKKMTDPSPFYKKLRIHVALEKEFRQQSGNRLSSEFREHLKEAQASYRQWPGHKVFDLYVEFFQNFGKPKKSSFSQRLDRLFEKKNFSEALELELLIQLAERLGNKTLLLKAYLVGADQLYQEEWPQASLFYYLRWLDLWSEGRSVEERVKALDSMTFPHAEQLRQAERLSLLIAQAEETKEKQEHYKTLAVIMSDTRDQYFLKRAVYSRALLNLIEADEQAHMEFVSSTWVRYTDKDQSEFIYAREQYLQTMLEKSYSIFIEHGGFRASGLFFGVLNLTDDLEAHYGYIQAMIAAEKKEDLKSRYEGLRSRGLDENGFAEIVIYLAAGGEAQTAIERLKPLRSTQHPLVLLLLGTQYLRLILEGSDDPAHVREANRYLVLAQDLAGENPRLAVTALHNLGLLHLRAQNFGQAAHYLGERGKLAFPGPDARKAWAFLYARALFLGNLPIQAAEVLEPYQNLPYQERRAFYLYQGGQFEKAAEVYGKILQTEEPTEPSLKAKMHFGLAYSQFKLEQDDKARSLFQKAIDLLNALPHPPQSKTAVFHPLRLKLHSLGFLAQIESRAQKSKAAMDYLRQRLTILEDEGANLWIQGGALTEYQVKAWLQIAGLEPEEDAKAAALKKALDIVVEAESPLSNTAYQAVRYIHQEGPALLQEPASRSFIQSMVEAYEEVQDSTRLEVIKQI